MSMLPLTDEIRSNCSMTVAAICTFSAFSPVMTMPFSPAAMRTPNAFSIVSVCESSAPNSDSTKSICNVPSTFSTINRCPFFCPIFAIINRNGEIKSLRFCVSGVSVRRARKRCVSAPRPSSRRCAKPEKCVCVFLGVSYNILCLHIA